MPLIYDEFEIPSFEDWREAAVKSLKGKPFESLITKTYEGIDLQPLYHGADIAHLTHRHTLPGQVPFLRGVRAAGYRQRPWIIAQTIYAGESPEDYNVRLLEALARGQTGVTIDVVASGWWQNAAADDLKAAFADVDLQHVPLYVRTHLTNLKLQSLLPESLGTVQGYIGDDVYALQTTCEDELPLSEALDTIAESAKWAAEHASGLNMILIRGDVYQDSGAHVVQELAFALASAVEHIRALQARGLDLKSIFSNVSFLFAVGPHFFMEVAKLRAARMLWSQVVTAYHLDAADYPAKLHVRSAQWNKTRLDPYVNMLRTTTEGIAAAVGGIESLELAPFDASFRQPDAFSERIARNQQAILQSEAHLTEVTDPAAGSYYVEWLTDQVAQRAWALFQQVEGEGGFAKAVAAGLPQSQIKDTRQQRDQRLANRQDVLVGTNMYANISEELVTEPLQNIGTCTPDYRAGAPFQALREAAYRYQQRHGESPGIFLSNIGSVASYKARADFTRAFFEVGGFAIIEHGGFDTVGSAVQAAAESDAQAVVICSTDALYQDVVEPITKGIKATNPGVIVILAGYPQADVDAYKAAGVDAFIHLRADCLAINQWLQQQIGVSK